MSKRLRDKAHEWMERNPRAYQLFCKYAGEIAATGRKFGAKLIAERIRYECFLRVDLDGWKWNNNHTKYVAQRWVFEHPHYAHLLTFRDKGDKGDALFPGV